MEAKRVVFADEMGEHIDRASHEPVYLQLVNLLRRQVAQGVLRPGDQLLSEARLCRRYQVSPMTVRRAINILVDQGVVTAEQGRGTFIRPVELGTASFQLQRLQELFAGGPQTVVRLLQARIVGAEAAAAERLQVTPGQRVIHLRRLILAGGEPTVLHDERVIYDPARPVVEAEMDVTALHGLFSGTGATMLKRGDLSVEAALLTAEEAELFQSPSPAAAFRIEHLFFDFDDRPVSWGWFLCRSDRLRFASHIGVRDSA